MSGIVGSRLNIRGSGLVGSLGTDGQVFTSSGAGAGAVYEAAAGTNTPYFFAYRGSSEQSIANTTQTIIEFNTELYDSGSCYDTGTYKFTPNVAGKYWINATVRLASGTDTDDFQTEIFKNTSTFSRTDFVNRNYQTATNSVIIDMNGSSDYIQVKVFQGTGGSANIGMNSDSTYQTFFQGFFIGS